MRSTSELAAPLRPWSEPNAMLLRFGLLLRVLARFTFRRARVEPETIQRLHELERRGTVVYVLPGTSVIDTLLVNHVFLREGLPVARFLGGISLLFLWPLYRTVGYLLRRLGGRLRRAAAVERFEEALRLGGPAVLYLRRPRQFFFFGGGGILEPYVEALIRAQRTMRRPIFLVPQLIIWKQKPHRARSSMWTSVWDHALGDPEAPGFLRKLYCLIFHSRRTHLRVGSPLDLQEFVARLEGSEEPEHAQEILRVELGRRFAVERRAYAGPTLKSSRQIREEILRNSDFDEVLYGLAEELGKPIGEVRDRADRYLKEIAANFSMRTVYRICRVLSFVFKRIYSELQVDRESLVRVQETARRGPVIFLPSHRSHVDYLVISYVLAIHGMVPPHIAAGANLDFWPIGGIFRRGGAFYLRRSFHDNPLYAATFSAYVRKLVKEGVSMEFFIEGGRSRTGKSLPPRFGLLRELVLAKLKGAAQELFLVPVGLSYERIVESKAYRRELSGSEKERESIAGLLKTPTVLWDRYGRLTVTLGEPICMHEEMVRRAPELIDLPEGERPEEAPGLASFVTWLAYRVSRGINDVILATPSALVAWALLAHPQRGVERRDLLARVGFLIDFLGKRGVPLAPTLRSALAARRPRIEQIRAEVAAEVQQAQDQGMDRDEHTDEYGPARRLYLALGEAVAAMVDESLRMFGKQKHVHEESFADRPVYRVRADRRIALDFYKNTVIHALVRECLIATAVLRSVEESAEGVVSKQAARDDCAFLSRILKYEFIYDPDKSFEQAFEEAWSRFGEAGWIDVSGEEARLRPTSLPLLQFFHRGILSFIEAYRLACSRVADLSESVAEEDFVIAAVREGGRRYATGSLSMREACSTATVKNALRVLEEMGILVRRKEGRKRWVDPTGPEGVAVLGDLADNLAAWARPRGG